MIKYELWIIDDNKYRIRLFKRVLEKEKELKNQLIIKQFKILSEALLIEGRPDFILIDTSSILDGRNNLYGCFDTAIHMCRHFAEKHLSANICIQSAVKSWSKDILEEMKECFGNEIIIDCIEAKSEAFVEWLKKYIGEK